MATHALSRRGFLGHVAGAYCATTIVAGTGAGSATLGGLIERHRSIDKAWGEASLSLDAFPSEANQLAYDNLEEVYNVIAQDILRFRPVTLEEAGQKLAYLFGENGPYWHFAFEDDDLHIVVNSMLPIGECV